MAFPLKILVLADFAPGREPQAPLALGSGGVDELMGRLQPGLRLGDPLVDLVFQRMEDFTPAALSRGRRELEDPEQLTRVLHHPHFQAIESAWRGLDFLARRLPGQDVQVEILNTPADQVRRRFYDQVFMPEYQGQTETPLSLCLLDFDYDHKPGSLEVLKDLARMGEALQVPLVAQTTAAFFGVRHLLHLAALSALDAKLTGPEYTSFLSFREHPQATWLGLCVNRFLLRQPYQTVSYQEPASADKPERYLWGRAVWILGANLARAWQLQGHPVGISGIGMGGEQSGLATRELPLSRKEKVTTPLEAVLPQPLVEMLPYFGLSPLTQLPADLGGGQQPDTAYLHLAANLRRFNDPTGRQPGRLTVYTTLAYSLMLGRAGNLALRLAPALGGLAPEEAADRLARDLARELGPLGQGELEVTPAQDALHIKLVPKVLIHSKPVELELEVPLAG